MKMDSSVREQSCMSVKLVERLSVFQSGRDQDTRLVDDTREMLEDEKILAIV